jgi:hypothetical protein
MPDSKPYRLVPELIPGDLWGRSAYKMFAGRGIWTKKIRPDALAKASNACEICLKKGGRLICHDKWRYDDKRATARLIGFEIHCGDCDAVTHLGRMMQVGDSEDVIIAAVIHMCNVNGFETLTATRILRDPHEIWEKRNKKKRKIEVDLALLKLYPELEALPRFRPTKVSY